MKEGIRKILASKSKLFAAACWCFLVGVAVVSITDVNIFFPARTPDRIEFYAPNKVDLTGTVADEPDVRITDARYIIEAHTVTVKGQSHEVRGRVYLKSDLYPRYEYGDVVRVSCTLRLPQPIRHPAAAGPDAGESGRTFRYDVYLARYHIFATCDYPILQKIGSGGGDWLLAKLLEFKKIVAGKIIALWPEPEASFMAGLLYGYRGGLGTLNDLFSRTGVTHIVAISGFNISIIATILINLCIYACVPRQKAFWLVSFGIVGFVIFTGASASVVRAGIMGIITLLATYVGRVSRIGNVLLLAAVTMTLQNPLVLMFDAGFQLSFVSTLGLVYLSPFLKRYEKYFPAFLGIRENVISTAAAIIATLPLILYQFGRLSIVAPVVNVLILWTIPWLMLLGVAAVISYLAVPLFGQIIAWLAWVGMEYVISIVTWFAGLSFAAVDISVPVWGAAAAYGAMVYLCIWQKK